MTERRREGYVLTTDPGRVDVDRVHGWLSDEAYWAKGREREVVERSIAGSTNYSVYADAPDGDARQAAFARVVTDGATYAWICDVFVDGAHRGRGLGSWMMESIVEDLRADGIPRIVLATLDAHEVYRRVGFEPLASPGRWMEIDVRPAKAALFGLD